MDIERFGDNEELVFSAELALLRRVAETGSDMLDAQDWPEFRMANGGQEKINQAHYDAIHEWQKWLLEGEG